VSVRTLPSILIKRCLTIEVTSRPVRAYFSLLRRKTVRGRDSRSLWGPGEGRGACEFRKRKGCDLLQFPDIYMNVHRSHSTYPTSMKTGRSGASNVFWVREPGESRGSVQSGKHGIVPPRAHQKVIQLEDGASIQ